MLVIHIGRGKAGSTTLQRALIESRETLAEHNVLWPSDTGFRTLGRVLNNNGKVRRALGDLKRALRQRPEATVVVSTEYLFRLPVEQIELLSEQLFPSGFRHEVVIVAYIRAYPDWMRSQYMQHARVGRRRAATGDKNWNFDRHFDSKVDQASPRPELLRWAEVFGREALHVRHLEGLGPEGIVGDFARLIGAPIAPMANSNESPHWSAVELARSMFNEEAEPPRLNKQCKDALRDLLREVAAWADEFGLPPARYLTNAQWRALAEIYRDDVDWLAGAFATPRPSPLAPPESERPFLPDIGHLPLPIVDRLEARQNDPAFRTANPYLAETLGRALAHVRR